ncbi:MAG: hypothetical protein FH760_13715 [Geosporobacter ferrireducens]|nr:hypothetical protein [Geosporobacter ferrireducens]
MPNQIIIPFAVDIRFIPSIREDFSCLKDSLRVRNINVSVLGFLKAPIKTVEYVPVPILIRSYKTSDELAASATWFNNSFGNLNKMVITGDFKALRANGIMFIFFGIQMVYASLFLALGKAKEGGILSMGRQGVFFIPIILILPRVIGLNGVIYAQVMADVLAVILTGVFDVKLKKEEEKLMALR